MKELPLTLAAAVLALAVGCKKEPSTQVPPPNEPPPDSGEVCAPTCGLGPDAGPDINVGDLADPMEFISTGTDPFGGFFEPVEVAAMGDDTIGLCTGVRGFVMYRAEDPCCVSLLGTVTPEPSMSYPRCQHFATSGDNVFIANHGDEISTVPFITSVNISDPAAPATNDTVLGDGNTAYEGLAVHGDVLYAALHDRGLEVFEISGDGSLFSAGVITEGLVNAWQPVVDSERQILYVADAQGGVSLYDIANPRVPRFVKNVPTLGTLKDVAIGDGYIYGASGTAGVDVIRVQTAADATLVTTIDTPGSALGIALAGDNLVVADWNDVRLYRVTEPAAPVLIGHQKAHNRFGATALGRILDVAVRGDTFFMAEWEGVQAHLIKDGADAPDLTAPPSIELPRTAAGETSATTITLENIGRRPLTVSRVLPPDGFTIDANIDALEPQQRALVTVTFSPTSDAQADGTLIIESDDPDEPALGVSVRANLPGLRTGDPAPPVRLVDLDGFEHNLSEFAGQPVLLAYFATF